MREMVWTAGKAFLIALIATPIFRDIFRSYHIVDRPGLRKVHVHPIPRVGGIPIAIAYGLCFFTFSDFSPSPVVWKLLPGAALIFLTGLVDDFFNLRPFVKLSGQIAAASLVFWNGVRMESIANFHVPVWLGFPVTVFWLLLSTNALNLIDGLDGLCAGMGTFATFTLFGAALIHDNIPLAHAMLPLAGALLGFLCYNFNPATVFLGDSGSMLIGFLLGCYGLIWTEKADTLLSLAVPLLALSIPLLDVSLSVIRRFLRNRPIFSADRGHIHHRLLDRGLSPRRAVFVLYLVATLAAAFALLLSAPRIGNYQGMIILAFCAAVWFGIRQLRYVEFNIVGQMLFGGEFQRTVGVKLELEKVAAALNRAPNEEVWWKTLVQTARDLGWIRVKWITAGNTREQVLLRDATVLWCFSISLPDDESVYIEGFFDSAKPSVDLAALAEAVKGNLPPRVRAVATAALSPIEGSPVV